MKKCVLAVITPNYQNHVKSLFAAIKRIGMWDGDFVVYVSGLTKNIADGFGKNVGLYDIEYIGAHLIKFNIFSERLKHWDRVIYFDTDFVICNKMSGLIASGNILASKEPFTHDDMFCGKNDKSTYSYLKRIVNVNNHVYNTGLMSIDTKIISGNAYTNLRSLQKKLLPITNKIGSIERDQPIINVYFDGMFDDACGVKYMGGVKNVGQNNTNGLDAIAMHTCSWNAPWVRFTNYYNENLNMYNELFK